MRTARPRHDLMLESLLLCHQLAVLTRCEAAKPRASVDRRCWGGARTRLAAAHDPPCLGAPAPGPRPRERPAAPPTRGVGTAHPNPTACSAAHLGQGALDLARCFCLGWREHLSFVTPETVVRWHRQGWRLFWRWKSRSRGGRPHLSPEVRHLIATMSRENRLWGTERIRGELLKLGIVVSSHSIRRHRSGGPVRSPSQTWRTFLRNHARHLWAADLLTVPTLTFKTLCWYSSPTAGACWCMST